MAFDSSTVSIGATTKKSDYDRLKDNTVFTLKDLATFTAQKIFSDTATFSKSLDQTAGIKEADSITGSNVTHDAIFDALSPYIPDTGDKIIINGAGADATTNIEIFISARRSGATTIELMRVYAIFGASSGTGEVTITDGSGTTIASLALNW